MILFAFLFPSDQINRHVAMKISVMLLQWTAPFTHWVMRVMPTHFMQRTLPVIREWDRLNVAGENIA